MTTRGAKYLAAERMALAATEEAEAASPEPSASIPTVRASAPLFELAAAHDGQPPEPWLVRLFLVLFGDRAAKKMAVE
jgi:hypothetical protein